MCIPARVPTPLWNARTGLCARGYTFVELLVVSAIIMILASAAIPLARVTATRTREAELRRSLREVRTAIDKFKDAADAQQIASFDLIVDCVRKRERQCIDIPRINHQCCCELLSSDATTS